MNTTPQSDVKETIAQIVREGLAVYSAIGDMAEQLAVVADVLVAAYRNGNKVLLFGNGGSAADAQHLATEFVGRFGHERPALPAVALTENTSNLTAIGNDYGFTQIFARQVEALGQPGDVAIGLSTSGRSPNVINGLRHARQKGLVTIALTGVDGGNLADEVDHCLRVPSRVTPRIQEGHILIGHILCQLVETALFQRETA